MYISRLVIRNFRNIDSLDVAVKPGVTCLIGENNSGKTNLLHAIRLAIDVTLPSPFRQLVEHDIHCAVDVSTPQQVLVSLELKDFKGKENECALAGYWQSEDDLARLHYRFRPKRIVREAIAAGEHPGTGMTLEDYGWELTGGGPNDPAEVEWNEDLGDNVRFQDLQSFRVTFLPALRDVQGDVRQTRTSPLSKLISATDIPQAEKDALVKALQTANKKIAESPAIAAAGGAITRSYNATAGHTHPLDVRLGMADPSFSSITRSLSLLLSNSAIKDFDPGRNGLGLNNVLYISMLLESFELRVKEAKTAGQLLLIEEPEAHLHPQLQRALYLALVGKPFQTIISTHSTHVTSGAPIESYVCLTTKDGPAISASALHADAKLSKEEVGDLERYLDATRSTLLFARKVILVEGPAELFLIPALVRQVMGIDLELLGISVIPIYGVHFEVYARLFSADALPKPCVIIADGDLRPSDSSDEEGEDEEVPKTNLKALENDYIQVFLCRTTFERELALDGLYEMLVKSAEECGCPKAAKRIMEMCKRLVHEKLKPAERTKLHDDLATLILNTAKRVGKARFAQVASRHINLAKHIPAYIREAVEWLTKE